MNLKQYVSEHRGRVSQLARAIGVSISLVSMWANETRAVPAKWCTKIERATKGKVTVKMLRPDLSWRRWRKAA